MSLFSLLGTARDGMAAQSAALSTTSANVANVSTAGYTRRVAVLETTAVDGSVRYAQTARTFDRFAYASVVNQQAKLSAATTRSGALSEMETSIAPTDNSVGDQAVALVASFNTLAGSPEDPSLRADALDKADQLASTISQTQSQLSAQGQTLLGQAGDAITDLNANLKHIADLNTQIATAQGTGADTNGLRDQRDQAIRAVGSSIGASAIEGKDGRVTLYSAGAVLVEGDHAATLSMDLDPTTSAMRIYASGAAKNEITNNVTTGTLGGIREARDTDLAATQKNLDQYAYDISNTFNAIHSAGYGSDGTTGRPLFTVPTSVTGAAKAMAVDASMAGHPEYIATAGSTSELPGGNSTALKLANLADSASFGGATLADRFAGLATDIGFRKNNSDNEQSLRTDTLASAESVNDSASGVSLDDEMVNLTQYQRAFEASSKVMQTASSLFDSLMAIVPS